MRDMSAIAETTNYQVSESNVLFLAHHTVIHQTFRNGLEDRNADARMLLTIITLYCKQIWQASVV